MKLLDAFMFLKYRHYDKNNFFYFIECVILFNKKKIKINFRC